MSLHRKWPLRHYEHSRHREAAIALYRELLRGFQQLTTIDESQRRQMQNVVRNRFKEHRYEVSQNWLGLRFAAGYQALDTIDAAHTGDETKTRYLLDLLDRTPVRARERPAFANAYHVAVKREMAKAERRKRWAEREEAFPQAKKRSIFDRPLAREELTGKRHVPRLFSADMIPILRIKKPQPKAITEYIVGRQKQKHTKVDQRDKLEFAAEIAKREDEWDKEWDGDVNNNRGSRRSGRVAEPSWTVAVKESLEANRDWARRRRELDQQMATRMQQIVDQEQALVDKEREDDARTKRSASR